jgi:aminopeptidase N
VPDADAALLNFDGISYAKGASVLRQLAAWLGFDAFVAGLRAHVATHAFGNATLDDLLAALGAASGRDLQPWSSAWLRTPEVSTLRPSVRAAGGRYEHVEIVQTGPGAAALRPHRLGVSLLTMRDGVCEATDSFSVDLLGASTPVPALAGVALPDLLLLNAGDLTYAKIRLDPVSLAALPRCLPYVPDPLTRSLLWGSAWDATRDGEMPATAFLDVVAAALPLEDNQAIFPAVLDYALDFAVDRFLAPGHRSPARHRLAVACRAALAAAPAGSGRQLTAARALIRCAGPADVGWLRAWLDDPSAPPRGLSVDTDLRWAVLAELCAHGAEVDIDAEYARDHTSTGAQHAARCRALVPTPAAKAAAWESIVADTTLSNKLVFAAASGFWRADQAELTAPYVARYAADMPDMVRHRPPQVAERTAELAYPRYSVDADSLATLTELAARPDLTPALRRALIDENDDLARSLNARNAL